MCEEDFADLPRHLRRGHNVCNATELKLLLNLASGRFKATLECPICNKRMSRLDMHLGSVHKLLGKDMDSVMKQAKRECILGQLAELRRTSPEPGMATELDICNSVPTAGAEPLSPELTPTSDSAPQAQASGSSRPQPHISPKGKTPRTTPRFEKSTVKQVLDDFKKFYTCADPTRKDTENACLRKSHALRFILHMASYNKEERFSNCKFLYNFERIRE